MTDAFLHELAALLRARKNADPQSSYTASLYVAGEDQILRKISEETTELILASKSGDRDALLHEVADLLYHTLVLLGWHDLPLQQVVETLEKRHGVSGLEEKAARLRPS